MHVLVATAGALPPASVSTLIERLARDDGTVTVMTSIGVPREFLEELANESWQPFSDDPRTPAIEHAVHQYVEERGMRFVEPVVAALAAAGVDVSPLYVEGSDAAQTIIDTAVDLTADLIVLGATRPIFDADAWESVSVRVMQASKVPMLLIPGAPRASANQASSDLEPTDS